jgi:hypothetical protein
MGFMDKLKVAAQDVATEAKKATAQGKTKLDQMQTRKKADDAAKRLGYLIHAERARGAASAGPQTEGVAAGAEVDRLVAEITQLEAEIAEAEAAQPPAGSEPATHAAPQPPPAPPQQGPPSADPTPGDSKL